MIQKLKTIKDKHNMLKPRYYYSEPLAVGTAQVAIENNEVIGILGDLKTNYFAPRVTICGIWDDEKNTLSFGVARCSSRDNFVKSIGRELAYKRALELPYCEIQLDALDSVPDVFNETVERLEEDILSQEFPIIVC